MNNVKFRFSLHDKTLIFLNEEFIKFFKLTNVWNCDSIDTKNWILVFCDF